MSSRFKINGFNVEIFEGDVKVVELIERNTKVLDFAFKIFDEVLDYFVDKNRDYEDEFKNLGLVPEQDFYGVHILLLRFNLGDGYYIEIVGNYGYIYRDEEQHEGKIVRKVVGKVEKIFD